MTSNITAGALRHRAIVLGVWIALLVGAAIGIARLRFDFSSQAFYAADPRQAAALSDLHAHFGPDDAELVVVVTAPDDLFTPPRLAALAELTQALRAMPGVTAARSVADLADEEPLASRIHSPADAAIARTALHASPAVPILLATNDRVAAIVVALDRSSDDVAAIGPVVESLATVVERHAAGSDLTFALAGVPVVRAAFHDLALADQQRLQPIVYVVVAVLLAIGFRRLHGVLVPLVAAGSTIVLLVGAMGWAGEPIGLLNQSYFTLLPVIAAADAVHWVARLHEELRAPAGPVGVLDRPDGHDAAAVRRAAIVRCGQTVGRACAWTAATTAAAFLSFAAASMPILRSFAVWAAIGVAIAYVVAIVLTPILLSWVRADPPSAARGSARLARVATTRPRVVILAIAIVSIGAAWLGARVQIDNRLGDLLDPSHPARRASAIVDADLGGTLSLEVAFSGPPGTFDSAEGLASITAVEHALAHAPEVRAVIGPSALAMPGIARSEIVDPTGAHARVRAFVPDVGGRAFEALARRIEAKLPAIAGGHAIVTGTARLAYTGVNRITTDLLAGLLAVLLVIALAIAILSRSLILALVALPVNALPLVFGLGVIALRSGPLDPIAMVVLSIGLGLAVDDTIHLILRAREHGGPPRAAFDHAAQTSGRAVVLASLALAAGLLVNMLSSFPPLRTLGLLGAITILAAMLADILLLPALVTIFDRRRG